MGWLSGWQYRKSHEIEGSSAGAQTNYQIRIIVHKDSGTDGGEHVYCNNHCRDDFGDIRFTKSDGITELDYWMEEYTSGDKATFWIKVDSIPASPDKATIYIYYGKSDATTTSDGEATFILFDDFEDGSLDTSKWSTSDLGSLSYEETNGYLRIYGTRTSAEYNWITSVNTYDRGFAIEYRSMTYSFSGTVYYRSATQYEANDSKKTRGGWFAGNIDVWRLLVYDGSTNYYSNLDGTYNTDTWYRLSLKIKSSGATISTPDGDINRSETYPTGAGYIKFGCSGNSGSEEDTRFDWLAVRKYVEPEPSHGSWGSEETSGGVEVTLTDSATGIEASSRPYRGLNFTDIATGQESFSRPYRQLQIPEQASSLELLLKTRNLNLEDIAAGLEIIQKARQIGEITDTAQSLEQILKQRFISLIDAAAGGEIIARPTRMTILADEALSQEILSKLRELTAVTDSAIGIEYVNIGAEGAIKTKIFLLIGDLAIQIAGD